MINRRLVAPSTADPPPITSASRGPELELSGLLVLLGVGMPVDTGSDVHSSDEFAPAQSGVIVTRRLCDSSC